MKVTADVDYLSARSANFAVYERERDRALERNKRGEYKEGEFERVRDAQRSEYVAAMGRAYAEFLARETRQAVSAPAVVSR
jgi:hypothetical protein